MIDTDDHQGIDHMRAKRQPSRAGAAWIIGLTLVACGGFILCWAYILVVTGQADLP
jgi:hypothetical protein